MDIYSDSFWAALGTLIIIFGIMLLVFIVVLIASLWRIFSKAGRPGWAAIIPLYNTYVLSDVLFGNANYFAACMVVVVLSWISEPIGFDILFILTSIASIALYIILSINLSKAFGKGNGFIVGMIFLPIIFYPILGFGSAEYTGPRRKIID